MINYRVEGRLELPLSDVDARRPDKTQTGTATAAALWTKGARHVDIVQGGKGIRLTKHQAGILAEALQAIIRDLDE